MSAPLPATFTDETTPPSDRSTLCRTDSSSEAPSLHLSSSSQDRQTSKGTTSYERTVAAPHLDRTTSLSRTAPIFVVPSSTPGAAPADAAQATRVPSPSYPSSALNLSLTRSQEPWATYIDFAPDDEGNPYNWSLRKRIVIVSWPLLFAAMTAVNATSYGTAQTGVLRDLGTSQIVFLLGNTVYLAIGVAFTPLILAPLSEIYGRTPIYLAAAALFTLMYIPQALAPNISCLLISRLIQGAAGSVGNSMVGGSVSDVFPASQRGLPMSMFCVLIYFGQAIGPVYGSYTSLLSWRWIFGFQAFLSLIAVVGMAVCLKETRGPVLLSRRAARLTREDRARYEEEKRAVQPGVKETSATANAVRKPVTYRCRADDERTSFWTAVGISLRRPAWWLISEPIVTAFSLWIGFLWGCVFLLLESVPIVFSAYGWTEQQKSLALLTIGAGGALGWLLNLHQERLYARAAAKAAPNKPEPEARLYWSCVGAVLAPAAMFMFAWTGRAQVHPAAPIVALVLFLAAIYPIYLAVFSYIADVYERFASSGLAAQSWLRNVFAGTFILFTPAMYNNLSPPIASTVLGAIGAVLGVCPFILMRYGAKIRSHSRVAKAMAAEEKELEDRIAEERRARERREARKLRALGLEKTGLEEKEGGEERDVEDEINRAQGGVGEGVPVDVEKGRSSA